MYNLARQLLFKLSPETSHDLSLDLIGAGGRLGLNSLLCKAPAKLPGASEVAAAAPQASAAVVAAVIAPNATPALDELLRQQPLL